METKNEYLTYDLGCSAALITAEFKLLELDRTNYRRIGFIFEYSYELEEAISNYWSNKLPVDARRYFENTKMLKTRIYSEK
jgi:hypothetical protein